MYRWAKVRLKVAGIALAGAVLLAGAARAEDIVLGAPISQTGTYAFLGFDAARGMQLAADEVNAKGLLGAGRRLRLIIGDDNSDKAQAITLANRMIIEDHAIALVGGAGSALAVAVAAVANDQQIPFIGIGTAPGITGAGKWSYRVLLGPEVMMATLSSYIAEKYHPHVLASVSALDNEGTVAQVNAARAWFKDRITVLPPLATKMAETDFSVVATKLAYDKPDAVVVSLAEAATANLIIQARQSGVPASTVFYTSSATSSPDFIRIGGAAVEGTLVPSDYYIGRPDALNQEFVRAYTARFGAAPSPWSADGYTVVMLIVHAVNAAGANPTRAAVRDAIDATHDFPSIIGAGPYSIGPDRLPDFRLNILVVRHGRFELAN